MQIVSESLSVRETEKLVKNLNKPQKTRTAPVTDEGLKLIYRNIEEQMRQSMGTKVSIKPGAGKGGKIEISYYNQDDLERISDLISKLQ